MLEWAAMGHLGIPVPGNAGQATLSGTLEIDFVPWESGWTQRAL